MGMKHSGKSTLARMLAWRTKSKFMDLDTLIEVEYRPDRMLSCREIYRQHGKEYFQELELTAAGKLADLLSSEAVSASLGGGTIDNQPAIDVLRGMGVFIYLKEQVDVLYRRIAKSGVPAFLDPEKPYEDFLSVYERRTPLYEEAADIVVPLAAGTTEESFSRLLRALEEKNYAR